MEEYLFYKEHQAMAFRTAQHAERVNSAAGPVGPVSSLPCRHYDSLDLMVQRVSETESDAVWSFQVAPREVLQFIWLRF